MSTLSDDMHFLHSSYREKLVEHLFVGELLKYLWRHQIVSVSVLKPEVDNTGYDIVLSRGSVIRHVQLKCSKVSATAAGQNINASLGLQPSGCVIWITIDDQLELVRYRWFGNLPGKPLPSLADFKTAKHTKTDSSGVKSLRPGIRKIPKTAFSELVGIPAVVDALFGPLPGIAE